MNCKPGDLAFVVHQSKGAPNAGRVVEVVAAHGYVRERFCWLVKSSSPLNGFRPGAAKCALVTKGIIPDAWLRPISGVPVGEVLREEVPAC